MSDVTPDGRLVVDGRDVGAVRFADSWSTRARGLLGTAAGGPSLLLRPAASVHGTGMTRSLDVALLDRDGVVRRTLRLRPFGLSLPRRDVVAVLESDAGRFAAWGLVPGSVVAVEVGGPGRPVTS